MELEVKVAEIDQRSKSNTHRLDKVEERQDNLDKLGVPWVEEGLLEPERPVDPPKDEPWYVGDQKWAQEIGISDGTRPEANVTRAEVWAMLRRIK